MASMSTNSPAKDGHDKIQTLVKIIDHSNTEAFKSMPSSASNQTASVFMNNGNHFQQEDVQSEDQKYSRAGVMTAGAAMLMMLDGTPGNDKQQAYIEKQYQLRHNITTASSFMPGNRPNKYMNILKKKKTKPDMVVKNPSLQGQQGKARRDAQTAAEDQKNRKRKMRKFIQNVSGMPSGYQKMVALNGGEAIGERDRAEIDEYLGIGSGSNEASFEREHAIQQNNSLKLLQDEQRDIEAKLKFIDALINQQQPSQNNKYFGGGILKKHTTEDFVVNLEQYQRAMEDLRQTMQNLKTQDLSKNNKNPQAHTQNSTGIENSASKNQYYKQYEEILAQQSANKQKQQEVFNAQQRQILSIIPTAQEGINEDRLSISSHYTNDGRLYDPTFGRHSYDSNQLRESVHSASYYSPNKLDLTQGTEQMAPKLLNDTSIRIAQTPKMRSQEDGDTIYGASNISENHQPQQPVQRNVVAEIIIQSNGTLNNAPVIEELADEGTQDNIINEAPTIDENGTTIEQEDEGEEVNFNEGLHTKHKEHPLTTTSAMTKVELTFEPEVKIPQKSIYESKAYKVRTQVSNPIFKSKNVGKASVPEISGDQRNTQLNLGSLPQPLSKGLSSTQTTFAQVPQKSPIRVPRQILAVHQQISRETDTSLDRQGSQKTLSAFNATVTDVTTHSPMNLKKTDMAIRNQDIDNQRIAEMGKKAVQLNNQQQSKLEVLDNSVIYQQDGDMTRGVLYFKNIDSLKNFILNKKRPIYSRKGDLIYQTEDAISGIKFDRKGQEWEEKRTQNIKADIQKKRQYLHKTLTNLMPQVQLKSLQHKTMQKPNFQDAIDMVSKKILTQTTSGFDNHQRNNFGIAKEMTWAPISNIQQYPFEEIMNPDGIIDLKILGTINPAQIANLPSKSMSRTDVNNAHIRSESSPGVARNSRQGSQMSKRLQTFYGFHHSNLDQLQLPMSAGGLLKPGGKLAKLSLHHPGTAGAKINHIDSEKSLNSESVDTNSSHQTNTRQVVFFKTSQNNLKQIDNLGSGTYHQQYPLLRPRLNNNPDGEDPLFGKHTVGMHQQYMKSSVELLCNPKTSQGQRNHERSLIQMNKGIERGKIKNKEKETNVLDQETVTSNQQMSSESNVASRKHVIFSNYEGRQQTSPNKDLRFRTNLTGESANSRNLQSQGAESALNLPPSNFKMPPLKPNATVKNQYNKTVVRSESRLKDTNSFFGSHIEQSQETKIQPKKDELPRMQTSPALQVSTPKRDSNDSKAVTYQRSDTFGRNEANHPHTAGSLRGLIRYENINGSAKKGDSSQKKMDINIAQHKFYTQN